MKEETEIEKDKEMFPSSHSYSGQRAGLKTKVSFTPNPATQVDVSVPLLTTHPPQNTIYTLVIYVLTSATAVAFLELEMTIELEEGC